MTAWAKVKGALESAALHDGWAEHAGADLDAATRKVLLALGIPDDADLKPFHKVGRDDGESVDGEHTWNDCDGPDDWTSAEWENHEVRDEPVTYYIDSYLRIGHVTRTWEATAPEPDESDEPEPVGECAVCGWDHRPGLTYGHTFVPKAIAGLRRIK